MADFSALTYDDAKRIVEAHKPKDFEENRAFLYEGDHYQGGKGFLGPTGDQPLASASEAAQRREHDARRGQMGAADIIQRGIEKGFTPEDVLGEAQARRTIVLLGKEPQFSVEPEPVPGEEVAASLPELTPEQAAALDAVLAAVLNAEGEASPMGDEERARMEAVLRADLRAWLYQHLGSDPDRQAIDHALASWWDEKGVHDTVKELADAVTGYGRAVLALHVPPGRFMPVEVAGEDGRRMEAYVLRGKGREGQPANAEEALESIFLDVLTPDVAADVEDPDTRRRAVFTHTPEGKHPITDAKTTASAQIAFVDEAGQTVLRVIEKGKPKEQQQPDWRMDLGGLPLMVEARERKPFVDAPLRQLQRALNTASTEMRIVNDSEGFPKHLLLNAMPPGEWTTEEDEETGRKRPVFKPAPFTLSPGSVAHVQGEEIFDAEGKTDQEGFPIVTGTKQASATTLPAGDPSGYVTEMEARRVAMLRRCRQLYALMTGDAAASGESRVQALYELHNDASGLKSVIDRAGKLALSAAWNLACHLAGEPERMLHRLGLRVVFDCRVTLPQPTGDQIDRYIKLVQADVWAPETAQAATGIDDTDAEDERIARAKERRLGPVERTNLTRAQQALARDAANARGDGQLGAPPDADIQRRIEEQARGGAES